MKVECERSINKSNVNDFVSGLFIVLNIHQLQVAS